MTGWRLGFLIADPDLINVMQNLNEGICYSAPSISQRAAIKALTSENLKEEIRNCFAKRVSYANQIISANSELDLVKAEGAFYLFPRIKKTGLKAEEFALRLLKEEGVLVLPGDDFGDQNGEFIRIACTLELSKLTEALARICSFTKKLKDDNLSNSKLNK
jgi:aspartate/methionine/tyrosine aminotransferase